LLTEYKSFSKGEGFKMSQMTNQEKDKKYVWHPFTQQMNVKPPVNIVKGEGVYLMDDQGNKYIDAISSWWVNLHGHCNPYISQKISEQLFQLEHSIFSDFTHPYAVNLAERLIKLLPYNQGKIFYSDNGSTAVEVALKMALQFWSNISEPKTTFIAFENAYHGDTFGSMSVGARNAFNKPFEKLLFDVKHIPVPTTDNFHEVKTNFLKLAETNSIAGFIFEPMIQGAGGMLTYKAEFLDQLIEICNGKGIVAIADEVMTGFGRTGELFASNFLERKPDIICLSKGLTGGYLPLGVTSCIPALHFAFIDSDKTKIFFHGHSYTANPISCSAALASLDLMEKEETWEQISMIGKSHLEFQKKISKSKKLRSVRTCGTIIAFELDTEEHTHYLNKESEGIADFFLKKGIILRPLGNIFYLIPPYIITKDELNLIYKAIEEFLH
jgi:adenosylmethionine-8-amino-7-oxononanoate aminotransferase